MGWPIPLKTLVSLVSTVAANALVVAPRMCHKVGDISLGIGLALDKQSMINFGIRMGANIEAQDDLQYTPLHRATHWGYINSIKALLAAHANVEAQNDQHFTPLHWAAYWGYAEAIKELLAAGAHIEAQTITHATPLHLAAMQGNTEALKILLEHGAHIEAQTIELVTPLRMAIMQGHTEAIGELIAAGAHNEVQNVNQPVPVTVSGEHQVSVAIVIADESSSTPTQDQFSQSVLSIPSEV